MTDPNRHLRTGAAAPWPKGVPRNPTTPEWEAMRAQLADVSQAEIARAAGVNRSTVCRWMRGTHAPGRVQIRKLRKMINRQFPLA